MIQGDKSIEIPVIQSSWNLEHLGTHFRAQYTSFMRDPTNLKKAQNSAHQLSHRGTKHSQIFQRKIEKIIKK